MICHSMINKLIMILIDGFNYLLSPSIQVINFSTHTMTSTYVTYVLIATFLLHLSNSLCSHKNIVQRVIRNWNILSRVHVLLLAVCPRHLKWSEEGELYWNYQMAENNNKSFYSYKKYNISTIILIQILVFNEQCVHKPLKVQLVRIRHSKLWSNPSAQLKKVSWLRKTMFWQI